jgi:hypothetical protein
MGMCSDVIGAEKTAEGDIRTKSSTKDSEISQIPVAETSVD